MIQYPWKSICEEGYFIGCDKLMYHIVPEFDLVSILHCTGFCHGVVRLVSSNGCALGFAKVS